jgi:hypothetical protein
VQACKLWQAWAGAGGLRVRPVRASRSSEDGLQGEEAVGPASTMESVQTEHYGQSTTDRDSDRALLIKHYRPSTTDRALRTKHYRLSTTDRAPADADINRIDVRAVLAARGLDCLADG